MKFKKDQRIEYRNGKTGIILSTERPIPYYPVVSMTMDGIIVTHHADGKVSVDGPARYDIVPSVPQGKDLCGILCGVSDCSLEVAKRHAKNHTILCIIYDYTSGCEPVYTDNFCTTWRYAWPVFKQDIEPCLLDEEEEE